MQDRTVEEAQFDYANMRVCALATKSLIAGLQLMIERNLVTLEAQCEDMGIYRQEIRGFGQEPPEKLPAEFIDNLFQTIQDFNQDSINDGQIEEWLDDGAKKIIAGM